VLAENAFLHHHSARSAAGLTSSASEVILMQEQITDLLWLSHEIGKEERKLTILAEGNVSAKMGSKDFAVKASGSCLANLRQEDLTTCHFSPILKMLEAKAMSDAAIESALMDSRLGGKGKKPSTETVFHAWLLTLEGINFVGHCHPTTANQVLCSPRARDFAERRIFPDEVVCCGPSSVFIPYLDPGLPLAREIRERTNLYIQNHRHPPRLILLQNHGIIALGSSAQSVLACLLMAAKAAEIFFGAAALGGPNFMTPQQVERISSRPDEAYRQKQLNL
jgi:rhamnose utilization protein RhaD (predicted bifunctional aldolase and dehydrogenase)